MTPAGLLPRARLGDVLRGRAALVGARLDESAERGWVSPVEARVLAGIPYGDLAVEERDYAATRSAWRDLGVLVRALVALLLSPRGGPTVRRPWIVSARVDNLSVEETLDWVFSPESSRGARLGFFVHPHALNLAALDASLRATLSSADRVFPDGSGLRLGSRLLGTPLIHNINGTDLLPLLCERAARERVTIALIGAAPGVAEECARRLCAVHGGLQVVLVSHGFLDEEGSRVLVERLERLAPRLILVGMGSPRQERWAADNLARLRGATVLTVGGLFDFYSGRVARAPLAWRELGLEWAYRLSCEPRRLAARYLIGNPLFILLVLAQRLRRQRRGSWLPALWTRRPGAPTPGDVSPVTWQPAAAREPHAEPPASPASSRSRPCPPRRSALARHSSPRP